MLLLVAYVFTAVLLAVRGNLERGAFRANIPKGACSCFLCLFVSSFVCFSCLLVGCLKYQKHASASQGRICSDNFTCYHTEIEVADRTFHLIQSQYTDTGTTSPSTDPITPSAWQSSGWSTNFLVSGMTRPRKNPTASGIRTPELPLSRQLP